MGGATISICRINQFANPNNILDLDQNNFYTTYSGNCRPLQLPL